MADFYVDHGAYASNIGATPTWGTPQEGDGSATSVAAASAVASILFNAVPTTGNFVICGVTFTSPAGVLSAASVDAAANALAGLINASTTTVGSTVAVGTPQLRNLVYARGPSGGAAAGTCEVMMRVGSTTLNHASNSNVAMSHTFNGTAPTLTQFVGGTGGCWGWVLNSSAIGVSSSIGVLTYGMLVGTSPMVWTATPTQYDTIWARTASGKTITYSSASAYTLAHSGTWPMRLIFDSNTKWTGDSGAGVFTLDLTIANASSAIGISPANAARHAVLGAVAQGGLKFKLSCVYNYSGYSFGVGGVDNAQVLYENIDIEDRSTSILTGVAFGSPYVGALICRGVRYTRTTSDTTLKNLLAPSSYSTSHYAFEGCSFTWNISGVSDPGPVVVTTNLPNYGCSIRFSGCAFSGWASGGDKFTVFGSGAASGAFYNFVVDQCTGVKLTSGYVGLVQGAAHHDPGTQPMYVFQSGDASGEFRHEQRNGITEWDSGASPAYPTLSATLPDQATTWAMKVIWFYTNGPSMVNPFRAAQLRSVNRLSAAARTVGVNFFYRTALQSVLADHQFVMQVTYINSATDKAVTEFMKVKPSLSGATWANAGSWSGYAAYELEITTANSVKQDTEIVVSLRLHGAPNTAQNENVFIDPEPAIA